MAKPNFPIQIGTWTRENLKRPSLEAECLELHTADSTGMIGFAARQPDCDSVFIQLVNYQPNDESIILDEPAIVALRDYCNRVLEKIKQHTPDCS